MVTGYKVLVSGKTSRGTKSCHSLCKILLHDTLAQWNCTIIVSLFWPERNTTVLCITKAKFCLQVNNVVTKIQMYSLLYIPQIKSRDSLRVAECYRQISASLKNKKNLFFVSENTFDIVHTCRLFNIYNLTKLENHSWLTNDLVFLLLD